MQNIYYQNEKSVSVEKIVVRTTCSKGGGSVVYLLFSNVEKLSS